MSLPANKKYYIGIIGVVIIITIPLTYIMVKGKDNETIAKHNNTLEIIKKDDDMSKVNLNPKENNFTMVESNSTADNIVVQNENVTTVPNNKTIHVNDYVLDDNVSSKIKTNHMDERENLVSVLNTESNMNDSESSDSIEVISESSSDVIEDNEIYETSKDDLRADSQRQNTSEKKNYICQLDPILENENTLDSTESQFKCSSEITNNYSNSEENVYDQIINNIDQDESLANDLIYQIDKILAKPFGDSSHFFENIRKNCNKVVSNDAKNNPSSQINSENSKFYNKKQNDKSEIQKEYKEECEEIKSSDQIDKGKTKKHKQSVNYNNKEANELQNKIDKIGSVDAEINNEKEILFTNKETANKNICTNIIKQNEEGNETMDQLYHDTKHICNQLFHENVRHLKTNLENQKENCNNLHENLVVIQKENADINKEILNDEVLNVQDRNEKVRKLIAEINTTLDQMNNIVDNLGNINKKEANKNIDKQNHDTKQTTKIEFELQAINNNHAMVDQYNKKTKAEKLKKERERKRQEEQDEFYNFNYDRYKESIKEYQQSKIEKKAISKSKKRRK